MKFIPKYITTDILAEYGEHLTHEAYNEMVKLNSTQGDYNSQVLNQLFNTDEGIQIPYLDKKIKEVTDDQAAINEDMEQVVADMAALAGSLSKYSTILETRRMIQYATQDFVKTNKIKAGENVEVEVDALNNVIISATGGGDVTKEYVDEHDASTLQSAKGYTDTKISQIPIPVVPTNISAFNNDVGYITSYTETDPVFSASAAAGITSDNITSWNNKSDFSGNYADLSNKPDLSVYVDKTSTQAISGSKLFTTIPQTNKQASENNHIINKKYFDEHIPTVPTNISAFNNDSGYITGYTETDPVFSASAAAGITSQDILDWSDKEIHILRDSDLDNGKFYLKGKKKGIYAFEHSVLVAYDDTHTEYEVFHYGFFYLYTDIPTDDSVSGPVGCFLGYTDSGYNFNGYDSLRWSTSPGMIMVYPAMPANMSGCSFSWSYSSTQYMSPAKFYINDLELQAYDYTATYNIGDWVTYDNAIYVCNTTISTPESFNSAHWTQQTAVDYLDTKYAISGATWGSITGTLSNQTDLSNALAAKSTATNLLNGTGSGSVYSTHSYSPTSADAFALGYQTQATQPYAFACGFQTQARGFYSYAEGYNTKATNSACHAEGQFTEANGGYSHSEGYYTIANLKQHVQGQYNINEADTTGIIHIVGNGTGINARSNAHTLYNNGDAWFAGDVYVGSTSGTDKDAGSVKLAKESQLPNITSTTTDPGAGSTLAEGAIVLVYE